MGKALYSKPSFQVHLLTLSGTGGGCNLAMNAEPYVCPIYDEGTGDTVFSTTPSPCDTEATNGVGCFAIPLNDGNTFHS